MSPEAGGHQRGKPLSEVTPGKRPSPLELLAPAGTLETFAAAIEAGADAVYLGAPAANARALARDFTPPELAAMIANAHKRGVKVYGAMNSLIKDDELLQAAATVELLAGLGVDALIIQDIGLYKLCRRIFPQLRLHASTLLGAHNSVAVEQFAAMGFARVVLARELTLAEIAVIARQGPVELEVFVHGAMCFSYSGLCLFSSYLGGKSGLRGRCVQPCRRAYRWGGEQGPGGKEKPGYLFSMNDLEALELLPELHRAGVGSVKIEGRMRSALYVQKVVRAYRLVIDALLKPDSERTHAMGAGRELLAEAMGRSTGAGFFQLPFKELVSPGHSGNTGQFLGRLSTARGRWGDLTLRYPLRKGDRLRLHLEPGGDRLAFTLREFKLMGGGGVDRGGASDLVPARAMVSLMLPATARAGDSLYKVDLADRRREERQPRLAVTEQDRRRAARLGGNGHSSGKLHDLIVELAGGEFRVNGSEGGFGRNSGGKSGLSKPRSQRGVVGPAGSAKARGREQRGAGSAKTQGRGGRRGGGAGGGGPTLPLWLRIDDPKILQWRLPPEIKQLVLPLSPESWPRFGGVEKLWRKVANRLIWALPPIILDQEGDFYREKIAFLRKRGCASWQLGHLGELRFFDLESTAPLILHADYSLNILNRLAVNYCRDSGFASLQASIESDRQNLERILHAGIPVGLTIYGHPPLFTSRLDSIHFRYKTPLYSPREEKFVLVRDYGQTLALADQPFSRLAAAGELAAAGLSYGVIDLRWQSLKREEFLSLLRQVGKPARRRTNTDFNFRLGLT